MSIKNYKLKIKNRGQLILKILIGFAVLVLVFGLFVENTLAQVSPWDFADPTTGKIHGTDETLPDISIGGWIARRLADLGNIFLWLVGTILLIAGGLFDYAVHLSLKGSTYGNEVAFVKAGWALTRDFANLFFIIIILWLAISLILQINTAGAKKALARLILVALVINFSLILVQVVIDFSNVVAFEFYKQIGASTDKETGVKNLSATFASGLSPELIFGELQQGQGEDKILPRIFIATIMGAIIIFVAAFVLLAGAYFFLARIISLWFVMILAPIIFLFYIGGLGKEGKGYVNRWQKSLISNAFFAPAFLFFFWLVVMIIKNPIAGLETPQNPFGELLSDPTNKGGALAGALDEASKQTATTPLTLFLFKYFLLIALLTACLRVAKETGMYGADTVTKWGGKAKSWATGAVTGAGARIARGAAAGMAEAFAAGKEGTAMGKIGRGIRAVKVIPFLAGAATKIAAKNRQDFKEAQKKAETMTSEEIKGRFGEIIHYPLTRAAWINTLAERNNLKPGGTLTEKGIQSALKRIKRIGLNTDTIEKVRPDLVEEETPEKTKEKQERIIKSWDKEDVYNIARNTPDIFANKEIRNMMYNNLGKDQWQEVSKAGGDAAKEFFGNLNKLGTTIEEISDKLKQAGNFSASNFVNSAEGAKMVDGAIERANRQLRPEETPLVRVPSRFNMGLASDEQIPQLVNKIESKEIPDIDLGALKQDKEKYSIFLKEAVKTFKPAHIQKLYEEGGEAFQDYLMGLRSEVIAGLKLPPAVAVLPKITNKNVADYFAARANSANASFFRTGLGRNFVIPQTGLPPTPEGAD